MAPPNYRRPGFSKRAQYSIFASYLLGILGAVMGLLLLLISFIDPQGFSALRTIGAETVAPISKSLSEIGGATGSAGDEISAYFNAASKNAAMQRELDRNRTEILEARALKQENERLKRLLKLDEEVPDSIAMARLISSTASSSRRIATLGVGSTSGLEPGQPGRKLGRGRHAAPMRRAQHGEQAGPQQRLGGRLWKRHHRHDGLRIGACVSKGHDRIFRLDRFRNRCARTEICLESSHNSAYLRRDDAWRAT